MSAGRVKKWGCNKGSSHSQVRTPILLIAVVGLALSAALTVFGTAYVIQNLKESLVNEARGEARLASLSGCKNIERVITTLTHSPLSEAANHPEVIRYLDMISAEGDIVLAEIRDNQGNLLCSRSARSIPKPTSLPSNSSGPVLVSNPDPRDLIPVRIPLLRDGQMVGVFQLSIVPPESVGRIELIGAQITSSLLMMVLIVFAILLLTVVIAYLAFLRQMALTQRTTESEHLADMGALASGLAHEVRNPLHAMSLHLEVVKEDLEEMSRGQKVDAKDSCETLARVQDQIARLNGIVGHFLNLSIPCRLSLSEMRLDQLVREVAAFLKPEYDQNGITLDLELPDEVSILGDQSALYQVLLNVLINSRQALSKLEEGKPRRVRVRAERDRKAVRLLVEDSGPGIPVPEREVIFKAFVSKQCGGTGVGLSIARKIMDGHKGRIRAGESEWGGALIELEFPEQRASTLIRRPGGRDVMGPA